MTIFLVEKNSGSFFVVLKEQFMTQANPFKCLTYNFLKFLDYSDCSCTSANRNYLKGFLLGIFSSKRHRRQTCTPLEHQPFVRSTNHLAISLGEREKPPAFKFYYLVHLPKMIVFALYTVLTKHATYPGAI